MYRISIEGRRKIVSGAGGGRGGVGEDMLDWRSGNRRLCFRWIGIRGRSGLLSVATLWRAWKDWLVGRRSAQVRSSLF
jgi:hypothetical protein